MTGILVIHFEVKRWAY